ncbi:MAG: hypothetical protein IJ225_05335 [Solobacterium sp.]|nr:hypothetical protein [Solobacterium sp.]
MKLIYLSCPVCGTALTVEADRDKTFCTNCGSEITLNASPPAKKQSHPVRTILLWLIFFPVMATLFLWRSELCNQWDRKLKAALTAFLWIAVLVFGLNGRTSSLQSIIPSKPVTIKANRISFGSGFYNTITPSDDATITFQKNHVVEIEVPIYVESTPSRSIERIFSEHDLNLKDFQLTRELLEINGFSLSLSGSGNEASHNRNELKELLDLPPGETAVRFVFDRGAYVESKFQEVSFLEFKLTLEYQGIGEYEGVNVKIPFQLTITPQPSPEEREEMITESAERIEEIQEEVPEEPVEEEILEEVEERPTSTGIRPEVKDAIDSYEAFIDEYIEFMEVYESTDNPASLLMEYASYMKKLSDMEQEMDALDDTDLTDEESLYYAEVVLRCDQKLLQAMQ